MPPSDGRAKLFNLYCIDCGASLRRRRELDDDEGTAWMCERGHLHRVPTPTTELRKEVLAFLDERGLSRLRENVNLVNTFVEIVATCPASHRRGALKAATFAWAYGMKEQDLL